jgi:16S rRNA (guanine527-N7)-methyltransferase
MKILKSTMQRIGIEASQDQLDKFALYREMVLEWNKKVNLTAIVDPLDFEIKHLADSLTACQYHGFINAKSIIDVGSGAGFPGLPMAICYPHKQFVLIDSLRKRVNILVEIIDALQIKNTLALHGRAEDLARDSSHRERYDLCASRAVANLAVLSEYCIPFVRKGGYFAAYKTLNSLEELEAGKKAIRVLGGRYVDTTSFAVSSALSNHQIYWIEKIASTPKIYPRKAGIPSKNPI